MSQADESLPPTRDATSEWDRVAPQVRDVLRGLKFGTVTIIVQDGVVVQIERTEKRRLRKGGA
jgi:hypothetical protein